jgi:hypothetical protein
VCTRALVCVSFALCFARTQVSPAFVYQDILSFFSEFWVLLKLFVDVSPPFLVGRVLGSLGVLERGPFSVCGHLNRLLKSWI